jgi:hypothetical protein
VKTLFRHLLLAALLLRALMPLGVMPGTAQLGQASFIICAADGSLQHGAPDKQDSAVPHQPCVFAAAVSLFDTPNSVAIAPPSSTALAIAGATAPAAPVADAARMPQAPRAPPFFA